MDDWSTVNLKRDKVSREFESLRQRYVDHRDTLLRLAADAPTQALASRYNDLVMEIETAVGKLSELNRSGSTPAPQGARSAILPARLPNVHPTPPADSRDVDRTSGFRDSVRLPPEPPSTRRSLPVVLLALPAIALVGWLFWKFLASRGEPSTPARETSVVTEVAPSAESTPAIVEDRTPVESPRTVQPPSVAPILVVLPTQRNFGNLRKGTQVARQFELRNRGGQPLQVTVKRAACRCLYYEYAGTIAPKGTSMLTVRLDAGKAPVGGLSERVEISAKNEPAAQASFEITAVIE